MTVSPAPRSIRGISAHQQAVERLLGSYRAIPPGSTVRLAKKTSNLFRTRAEVTTPGLDVSGLDGVIDVDPATATAQVQGICTYEDLVAATLPHGLMPYVVPQLRTITLAGAVTGMGIESSSFRDGLPHESVLEMDVLTGSGEIVTATPDNEHRDLFRAFPNSYGSLGYATRLKIQLRRTQDYVRLRHVRFDDLDELTAAVETISTSKEWEGHAVDFLDGVVFDPNEAYLTLGSWTADVPAVSDYTGQEIYYRSIRDRGFDALTTNDYIWRWDTDWFWCSAAFGAQNKWVRKVWPTRYRRSDVYHRMIAFEAKHRLVERVESRRGLAPRERVIQDVEVTVDRTADFLRWFFANVPMTPVWICPARLRDDGPVGPVAEGERPWPLYPLKTGTTYVNIGFWGTVRVAPGRKDGDVNRDVEQAVADLGGHKSLYSDAYYDEETFWAAYGGDAYQEVKRRYDPEGRLLDLYEKTVGRK